MLMRQFKFFATVIGFSLITAETVSASSLNPPGIVLAATISVAGEVGKTTSQPSLSLDAEQNCGFSGTNFNHLDALTRAGICSELAQLSESLQRLRIGMASLREFIIAKEIRCNQMDVIVMEKAKLLRELGQELLIMQQEREHLKYLLTDLLLNTSE